MDQLITLEAEAWRRPLGDVSAPKEGRIVVRGPGAGQVGAAWHLLGYGSDGVVTDEAPVTADEHEVARASLVGLLHAWSAPAHLEVAARTAATWLRPGGMLLLAELHMDRLRSASTQTYTSSLLYRMFPTVADDIGARCAGTTNLVAAAVRTSLDDKLAIEVDRPLAVYEDAAERKAAVGFGAWRGLEQLEPERYAALLDAVGRLQPVGWPHVEVEPWYAVTGRARR